MLIGLYFGSFNPIHTGHLIIATHVINNSKLDQIWFVVSPQNPLKKSTTLLNEYHRLHLVTTAIQNDEAFRVTDIEFKLPRPSFTIDTLTYLTEKHPKHTFTLIIGSDSYNNIQKWKNSEILMRDYSFIIYERPGYPVTQTLPNSQKLKAPLLDISATDIRQNIKNGKSIKYLVPEPVREEIEKNGYYKNL